MAGCRAGRAPQGASRRGRAGGRVPAIAHGRSDGRADARSVEALFARVRALTAGSMRFSQRGAKRTGGSSRTPVLRWKSVVDTNLTALSCAQRPSPHEGADAARRCHHHNGSISAHAPRPDSALIPLRTGVTGLTRTIASTAAIRLACCKIDIGNAMTELAAVCLKRQAGDGAIKAEPMIAVDDVARSVMHMGQSASA